MTIVLVAFCGLNAWPLESKVILMVTLTEMMCTCAILHCICVCVCIFQFAFSVTNEEQEVMLSLMQKDSRQSKSAGGEGNFSIGYFIMKVCC